MAESLLDKLEHLVVRFEEVGTLIADPSIISDMDRFVKLNKEYSELEKIVTVQQEYKKTLESIREAKAILEHEADS
ncbi:MAG TPA: peptide chain release factor 1, partial [Porphyromonadaceae bacterium]|nr:peptide chain release factor 1 [Porphyromonadaceae bacterium]